MPPKLTPEMLTKLKDLHDLVFECTKVFAKTNAVTNQDWEYPDEVLAGWSAFSCPECNEVLPLEERTQYGFCPNCCEATKEENKYDQPYWRY